MVKEKVLSAPNSIAGWKFSEWFKGNWKTLKELIKIGVPFAVGLLVSPNPALITLITIVGKLLMDTGEYYFSTIKLKK